MKNQYTLKTAKPLIRTLMKKINFLSIEKIAVTVLTTCFFFASMAQDKRTYNKDRYESLTDQLINGAVDSAKYLKQMDRLQMELNQSFNDHQKSSVQQVQLLSTGTVYYVSASASPGGDGLSWANAFDDLQSAVASAVDGDQIWVASGIYKPTSTSTRTIHFTLKSGVSLFGGFSGTEMSLDERDWKTNVAILSGEIGDAVISDNTDQVVRIFNVSNITLDGFTIEDGYATTSNYGGGIYCSGSQNIVIENCVFRNNTARYHGGGVYAINSTIDVINSVFYGNSTISYDGGGYFSQGSFAKKIIGCLFYDNYAGRAGGAIEFYSGSNSEVINCTITGNSCGYSGNGLSSWGASVNVRNSIAYDNNASTSNLSRLGGGNIYAYWSLIQYGSYTTVEEVIDADPLFVEVPTKNFRLQPLSPCIDAGTLNLNGFTLPAYDIDGIERIQNSLVDMGAYEFEVAVPQTFYAISSGSWDDPAIWSNEVGGAPAGRIPTQIDDVHINGFTITVSDDTEVKNIQLENDNQGTELLVGSGTLTVYGLIKIKRTSAADNTVNLNVDESAALNVLQAE